MLSTLHVTHQFSYLIYLFHQDESKFERISRIHQIYQESYQENKIEFLDELYFNSNLHSNLNIKSEFQENSQFSTSLCYSCMIVIEFFSMSHHVMMVLTMKNESYYDSQMQTLMQTLKMNGTTMRHPMRHICMPNDQIIIQIYSNIIFC